MDTTRDGIGSNINRDDLLTKKDINNIKTCYNIDIREGCRHKEDAVSVSMWVQECKEASFNPVLFFKGQGEELTNCNLNKEDFCLIFMNSTQISLLKKFGTKILCIDGTHGLNSYNFELTTIMVLDEYKQGFPVAFLFSNRKDSYIYEIFFQHVKQATGTIDCSIFMSDITNVYYNAWQLVMGPAQNRLFCTWHIDRAWQQNLSKVADPEKRKWVYKTLKYLQTNLNKDEFEYEFEQFLKLLQSESSTTNMFNYLMDNYYNNRQQWAYSYRKKSGINTNMFLESMHKTIKYTYLEGKKVRRLDKSLHALQKFLRDKTIERLIKLTKGKSNEHTNLINKKHRLALTTSFKLENKENVYFLRNEQNQKQFAVTKQIDNACCQLRCMFCNICIHMYECSCLDYVIKFTICQHIHFVCLHIKPIPPKSPEREVLAKREVFSKPETQELAENILINQPVQHNNIVNQIKETALQLITNIDNRTYSIDEEKFILKNLKVLTSLGSTFKNTSDHNTNRKHNCSPPNKKIDKQKMFSTKKKNKQKKIGTKKPNSEENKIIKDTLSQSLYVSNDIMHDHLY